MTRCVYQEIAEVPRPQTSRTAIIRATEWTLLRVHPGTPIPVVAKEIAAAIEDEEVEPWLIPYLGETIDLSLLASNPLRILPPEILSLPCVPLSVPQALRAPWVRYN